MNTRLSGSSKSRPNSPANCANYSCGKALTRGSNDDLICDDLNKEFQSCNACAAPLGGVLMQSVLTLPPNPLFHQHNEKIRENRHPRQLLHVGSNRRGSEMGGSDVGGKGPATLDPYRGPDRTSREIAAVLSSAPRRRRYPPITKRTD